MAGEKIIEALELADTERAAFREYEDLKAKARSAGGGMDPPEPARNAVLAAWDVEPEAYVLRVVEKIGSSALLDALLVLPFGKVVSLLVYLNEWTMRVRTLFPSVELMI